MAHSVTGIGDPGGALAFYKGAFVCSAWVCFAHYRMRVLGRGRIPRRGPFILASNHQSFFDPVLVGYGLDREIDYMARDTLFKNPVFKKSYKSPPTSKHGTYVAAISRPSSRGACSGINLR